MSRSCFFIMPQVSRSRDRTAAVKTSAPRPAKLEARRPAAGTPGLVAMNGLRVRRSQRRSDGRRRLCRSEVVAGTAWAAVEVRPPAVVRATGTHGVVLSPVVMASVVTMVAGNLEAGEEDGRDDEQDPGDDHNPRREPVEPIRFSVLSRWRCGVSGDRGRPGRDFRCFTHAEMMRGQRIGCAGYNL